MRILTLASGAGSNFRTLLEVHGKKPFAAEFVGLIVDRPDTGAASIAEEYGIAVQLVDFKGFADRKDFHAALLNAMVELDPGLVVGAGFMRILPDAIIHRFENRIMNLHPSLLPAFPGLHAQRQALHRGVKVSGCTVHFMDTGVDTGPIIAQKAVDVPEGCDEPTLAGLIQEQEHELLPQAVRWFCEGRLKVEDGRVHIR